MKKLKFEFTSAQHRVDEWNREKRSSPHLSELDILRSGDTSINRRCEWCSKPLDRGIHVGPDTYGEKSYEAYCIDCITRAFNCLPKLSGPTPAPSAPHG